MVADYAASAAEGGRRRALDGALAEAVRVVASRHVPAAEIADRSSDFQAVSANTSQYVRRYTIQSEATDAEGIHLRVAADVDRDRLLADLESARFTVLRLPVYPRVLIFSTDGEASRQAAEILLVRLREEGFDARSWEGQGEGASSGDVEALRAASVSAGFHVAAYVSAAASVPVTAPNGSPAPAAPAVMPAEPSFDAESRVFAGLVDTRTGGWLAREETTVAARGADRQVAEAEGVERAAEVLSQRLLADVIQSGWTTGREKVQLEVRVQGLVSPGAVVNLQRALSCVAEFDRVRLDRIEARTAVWRLEAVRSGIPWDAILRAAASEEGRIVWTDKSAGRPGTTAEPILIEGLWATP